MSYCKATGHRSSAHGNTSSLNVGAFNVTVNNDVILAIAVRNDTTNFTPPTFTLSGFIWPQQSLGGVGGSISSDGLGTATVTQTGHGYTTGRLIRIVGADQAAYNGDFH